MYIYLNILLQNIIVDTKIYFFTVKITVGIDFKIKK